MPTPVDEEPLDGDEPDDLDEPEDFDLPDDADESVHERGDLPVRVTWVDRLLGVDADELDEHGISRRVGISWPPPQPLIVAVASFFGAAILYSTVYQSVVTTFGYEHGPVGLAAPTGEVVGQLATGQATQVSTVTVDMPLTVHAALLFLLWLPLAVPAVIYAWRRGAGVKADLGLELRARDLGVGAAIGVAAQLLVPLLYVVLRPFIGTPDVSAEARELTDQATDAFGVALLVFITVICAPVVEEIYYRGLVLRAAERSYGPTAALLGSSVFFAINHFQPLQFPALLLFAVLLAWIALRTGRIGMTIAAHVAFNLTTVVILLAFPS